MWLVQLIMAIIVICIALFFIYNVTDIPSALQHTYAQEDCVLLIITVRWTIQCIAQYWHSKSCLSFYLSVTFMYGDEIG